MALYAHPHKTKAFTGVGKIISLFVSHVHTTVHCLMAINQLICDVSFFSLATIRESGEQQMRDIVLFLCLDSFILFLCNVFQDRWVVGEKLQFKQGAADVE